MPLTTGTRLGSYEVIGAIGAGGMGEVYRARDTRLGRDAAIKILPDAFLTDVNRVARFEREAKTLAALNHPNIAQIYGLEERALVMELVEGEDLSALIARGPVPIDDALRIARQIAAALEAAHEQGIVHRDLKPANIKIRGDGVVKVLDFGLAKASDPSGSSASLVMNSPTITGPATELGTILGTAAYMSPEQARGKSVDRRADVWAFGIIVYEMLTGRRAFEGSEVSDVLASVLKDTVPLDTLPADVPAPVRRLLRRCLEKDRAERLDSMTTARLEIAEAISGTRDEAPPVGRRASGPRWRAIVIPLAAAIAAAGITAMTLGRLAAPVSPPPMTFPLTPPGGGVLDVNINQPDLAISPDGRRIVYGAAAEGGALVMRSLDDGSDTPLQNLGELARAAFFSPDGTSMGYFVGLANGSDGRLMKVPVGGGAPMEIARIGTNLRGASWGDNGVVVFGTAALATGLMRAPASGGAAEAVTVPDRNAGEVDHLWPVVLPGSRQALFAVTRRVAGGAALGSDIAVVDLERRTWRVVRAGGSYPIYAPNGYLLYSGEGGLSAVRFDTQSLESQGEPFVLRGDAIYKPTSGAADVSLSANGVLAYVAGSPQNLASLAWVDRRGVMTPTRAPVRRYQTVNLSPDESRVVVAANDSGLPVLWVYDLVRETLSPLTPGASFSATPVWSLDGREIFFTGGTDEHRGIYRAPASGTSPPVLVMQQPDDVRLTPLSMAGPDSLLVGRTSPDGRQDVQILSLASAPTLSPLFSEGRILTAAVSPDGKWFAYIAADGGPMQLFLRPYPNIGADRIQLSANGARSLRWSGDSRMVFFQELAGNALWAITIGAGGRNAIGKPELLPGAEPEGILPAFDVSRDGRRSLRLRRDVSSDTRSELRVITSFFEFVRRADPSGSAERRRP